MARREAIWCRVPGGTVLNAKIAIFPGNFVRETPRKTARNDA